MNRVLYFIVIILILILSSCKKVDQPPWAYTSYKVSEAQNFSIHKIKVTSTGLLAVGGNRYESGKVFYWDNTNWQEVNLPPHRNKAFYDIAEHPTNHEISIVGLEGNIVQWNPLQTNWEFFEQPFWEWMKSAFYVEDKLFIVSGEAFHNGKVFQLDDNNSLQLMDTFEMELNHISQYESFPLLVLGYGSTMFKNTDHTWEYLTLEKDHFIDLSYTNSSAYIIGVEGGIWHLNLNNLMSKRLTSPKILHQKERFRALQMLNEQEGFIVGDNGLLMYTLDGWASTQKYQIKEYKNADFLSISLLSPQQLWIGTSNGYILKIKL